MTHGGGSSPESKFKYLHFPFPHETPDSVTFALCGAYLIGLPLISQMVALNLIAQLSSDEGHPSPSFLPFAPYLHIFLPWIFGTALIAFAIVFANRSYRDEPLADSSPNRESPNAAFAALHFPR
jgi:hypothetical protein